MEELLKALGYPASGVIVFLFMAYVWRKIFENCGEREYGSRPVHNFRTIDF